MTVHHHHNDEQPEARSILAELERVSVVTSITTMNKHGR